jgi:hypothetical protein
VPLDGNGAPLLVNGEQLTATVNHRVVADRDDGDVYAITGLGALAVFDRHGNPIAVNFGPFGASTALAVVAPTPAGLGLSPSTLSFTAAGQIQSIAVVDTSGGTVSQSNTCSGIATIGPPVSMAYAVTAVSAGSCVVTFSDTSGNSAMVTVGVTTTTLVGQSKRRT